MRCVVWDNTLLTQLVPLRAEPRSKRSKLGSDGSRWTYGYFALNFAAQRPSLLRSKNIVLPSAFCRGQPAPVSPRDVKPRFWPS